MINSIFRILLFFFLTESMLVMSQKQLAEFQFNDHLRPINVSSSVGFGQFQVKSTSPDIVLQAPAVITELDETTKAMFFQFQAYYSVTNNNVNIAFAPKAGKKVRVTHIEFRVRFASTRDGNAGVFISKDPETKINTQLWSCGNNQAFNTYKHIVAVIEDSELNYSESETDSIRFVFGHGTNTKGFYLDDFIIYGIVNDETNPSVDIALDASNTTKDIPDRPTGANTCWLMDSDIKWERDVTNEERFAEMKLGALRFPYGHLADNYLWHTPGDYSNLSVNGPTAMTASPSIPSEWSWAVNQVDGTFPNALSFDEFIAICKRQNIEPLVVVNAASYTYDGGPSYEVLKQSAVEWVKYANITKGYGVKYWQIGNEVEHKNAYTLSEYSNLFIDFATAMKAVDPTIKIGTGVLGNTSWNKDVLNKAGNLCDFISNHNYQWNGIPSGGFRIWYKESSNFASNTQASQNLINKDFSHRPELEIHVTETNVTGDGGFPDNESIDLYKALYWFEMNMNQLSYKNVKYIYYWGTHSPWDGETALGGVGTLLENSKSNTIRPAGRVIQLINKYLKHKWIDMPRVTGNIRAYASVSNDTKELSLFLLNKNLYAESVNLNINNFQTTTANIEKVVFTGNHFNDNNPQVTNESIAEIPSQLTLSPLSITILNIDQDDNTITTSSKETLFKMNFDGNSIMITKKYPGKGTCDIYSMDGRKVKSVIIEPLEDRVNLTSLNRGVYSVLVQINGDSQVIKIVK